MKVTCISCKAVEIWELDALITEVRNNGGNTDWHTARYAVKCPDAVHRPIITLLPIPYRYAKAGIVLVDLYQAHELPTADMFATRS